MVRRRVISVLTFFESVLTRTKKFKPDYRYTANFVDTWSIDEIILLNISPNRAKDSGFKKIINKFAKSCFVPLAAGGGVNNLNDAISMIDSGADKVILNSAIFKDKNIITDISKYLGSQCCVVSLDCKKIKNKYYAFSDLGKVNTGMECIELAKKVEKLGAGEIMINCIEKDGSLEGYDLELCSKISNAVKIPVLISGGAGNWEHFAQGFLKGNADAVCTSNIYHFTEKSIKSSKLYLKDKQINVRI
mgnify:CR=1 FL=1